LDSFTRLHWIVGILGMGMGMGMGMGDTTTHQFFDAHKKYAMRITGRRVKIKAPYRQG